MSVTIGPLHVRRSVFIRASAERVWQEFTTLERIRPWLSRGHVLQELDLTPGGQVEFSVDIDGAQKRFGGRVLVIEPTRELTFESNWQPPDDWPVPTYWTFRLTSLYNGTLVEVFHHGFETLGAQAAEILEGYELGWDIKHLVALKAIVEA